MRRVALCLATLCFALNGGPTTFTCAQEGPPERRPYGIEKRVPWLGSRIHGTPDAEPPYVTRPAFGGRKFHEPLAISVVPGTSWLAVAQRPGQIYAFPENDDQVAPTLVVDLKRTVYGLAFHPHFAENGYFFVSCLLDPANPTPEGSRISRFQVTGRNPLRADPASETIILSWPSGGHNGGCIRFGPDGYLYLATGDGSGIADQLETGQDLSDLLGAILRIDVDRPADGKPYSIPRDNPFVDVPGARPETYSYGHRQVWRFAFDPPTGHLWAGEVGQDLWEMVYLIKKGGNYGWSVNEGAYPFRPERKRGPHPFEKPVVEHGHADFRSLTGGVVYRGRQLPELHGHYIYGDYDTGRIWSFRYDDGQVREHRELADTQLRIVDFGLDSSGELLIADFARGQLSRLEAAPPATEAPSEFPRKLSETGLFASTRNLTPAPGLIPYSVNAELWSDGARKERYLALPGTSQIEFDTVLYPQGAPGAEPGWRFPHDTVLVKTFHLELEAGNPSSSRRLETRILHHKRMPGTEEYGDQYWRGYTYVWNDEQTDAELLGAEGLERTFTIRDPRVADGVREQAWRFPSRAECTLCHTMAAKYALGVNTLQMNRDHRYGGVVANQLATLEHLGVFTQPLPNSPARLPRLANDRDDRDDLNQRARAYLHANCSHCHRQWGGGNAEFQLLASLPLSETRTLDVRPGQGSFDLPDPRLLVSGDPHRSLILFRMQRLGLGRMPHVASTVVDQHGVDLIRKWIAELNAQAITATGIGSR